MFLNPTTSGCLDSLLFLTRIQMPCIKRSAMPNWTSPPLSLAPYPLRPRTWSNCCCRKYHGIMIFHLKWLTPLWSSHDCHMTHTYRYRPLASEVLQHNLIKVWVGGGLDFCCSNTAGSTVPAWIGWQCHWMLLQSHYMSPVPLKHTCCVLWKHTNAVVYGDAWLWCPFL